MEYILPTGRSVKEYVEQFATKKNYVPKIIVKATYTTVKSVLDAVDKNIISMLDDRDNIYGKLHLVSNTSHLAGGPAHQVVQSTNQGWQLPYVHHTATARERQNYLIEYHQDHGNWLDDQNAEESLKNFILIRVDKIYLDALCEPRFQYKGKTLW